MGQPFNLLYENYRLFDNIGPESHVPLKFYPGNESPELYYYSEETNAHHLMSVNFVEYLGLALQTKGLYAWQEFFIADNGFSVHKVRAAQFMADLELLFPEVDRSQFHA